MKVPTEFDDIRPYEPEELPTVFNRLLADKQFCAVLAYVMPGMSFDMLKQIILSCRTGLEFQKRLCYVFLENLISKATSECTMNHASINTNMHYTFVSNHRDIVIDSAFLCKLLIDSGFDTTCEIAIGDNLLSLAWVKDLVRVNKSFIVKRGLSPRETLVASKKLSDYMHFVMDVKHDNMWIAQREGRAKDSDDRTQPAILKMMAMGGADGSVIEKLSSLHIVPLAISYEYDPCDYLKAKEFQHKRDIPGWKKTKEEDVVSMQTGVIGYKGRVHYHCAPCIDNWLGKLDKGISKTEIFDVIAAHIDEEIHRNYYLFPVNYIALDLLNGVKEYDNMYSEEEKTGFEKYIEERLAMIDLVDKDEGYLRQCLLMMYANPAKNHLKIK
ncbi:MAG: acyltransferase [Prevotella sp.]